MEVIAERSRPAPFSPESPPRPTRPVVIADHDLPVLAAEIHPRVTLDWEGLLAAGVHPALALGAERRSRGSR